MRQTIRIATVYVLFTLGGCGGGGDTGPISPDELGGELGSATCERMFECCNADELMAELGMLNVDTVEECTAFFAGFTNGFLKPQIEAAIASGRLVYHADRMRECLTQMMDMSCSQLAESMTRDDFAAGCTAPFEGQVAAGGACASDMECQSATCIGESMDFEGNVVEGTCGTAPGTGDSCDFGECGSGFYCEYGMNGAMCAAAKASGAECFSDDECTTDNCAGADQQNNTAGACAADYRCDGQ